MTSAKSILALGGITLVLIATVGIGIFATQVGQGVKYSQMQKSDSRADWAAEALDHREIMNAIQESIEESIEAAIEPDKITAARIRIYIGVAMLGVVCLLASRGGYGFVEARIRTMMAEARIVEARARQEAARARQEEARARPGLTLLPSGQEGIPPALLIETSRGLVIADQLTRSGFLLEEGREAAETDVEWAGIVRQEMAARQEPPMLIGGSDDR